MGAYQAKPVRLLENVHSAQGAPGGDSYCAGFELEQWRCEPLARHLIEWLPEYALPEPELAISHANAYVKLREAAIRVYTSAKYEKRGEAGEIALHAICRDFFDTIPISPRVFYKSTSNDVVKSFDMVHARFPNGKPEIWLGESKLYTKASDAITDAIGSVSDHLDKGFLTNQKLLLGPQIPSSTPHYDEIRALFQSQTSLDKLISAAVFVVGIFCESDAIKAAKTIDDSYREGVASEWGYLSDRVRKSGLAAKIKIALVYLPLLSKKTLVEDFDKRLKGLQ
ncbi:DUF1837 domain-containing protein [Terricaulis sp.]|uniref:HamA C-terminal domain-containing protein n=1 Tax=Terricaulis sp. TaxID=2768686 RepID=UPI002AC4FD04|nr:DUF1837 domain-containing protein [Terricaulis sp.]MDZ4691062.1 DUF1837 domain-containing protein [Terricaulis sp.]